LSDTAEKMGVQLDSTSTSAIHRLQERLWFSEEASIVRVRGTHETSSVD
jgi:hypothetical protein